MTFVSSVENHTACTTASVLLSQKAVLIRIGICIGILVLLLLSYLVFPIAIFIRIVLFTWLILQLLKDDSDRNDGTNRSDGSGSKAARLTAPKCRGPASASGRHRSLVRGSSVDAHARETPDQSRPP